MRSDGYDRRLSGQALDSVAASACRSGTGEAVRAARGGGWAATALVVCVGLASCSSSSPAVVRAPNRQPCAAKPHGALCIKVFADGSSVHDVAGYLSATDSPLAGQSWRLVLTSYPCDPGTAPVPRCALNATYPGPTRSGAPPLATSCRNTKTGAMTTTPPGCHDTLAEEIGTHGDWSGFMTTGQTVTLAKRTWLCVSEQLRANGAWQQATGRSAPQPIRACSKVPA